MSQMPNKIWLHKDTKYNTGDAVWGYQYKCAQEIEYEGIENFVEYVPVDAFIEEACEWLKSHSENDYVEYRMGVTIMHKDKFIKDFKNYMKEE